MEAEDVEDKWNNYHHTAMQALHRYFREKSVQLHLADTPWITVTTVLDYSAYTCSNIASYRSLRNKVIREIKTAKKTHYPKNYNTSNIPI